MLTVDRMNVDYRIAGTPGDRARKAARLDRLVQARLAEALEELLGELDDDDGPVYRIRRLDIRLWLNLERLSEPELARDWAETILRALYRQIAEAGPDLVMRYPDRAAYLSAFLSDLIAGGALSRWMYQEFRPLEGVPTGRAVALVLGAERRWIGAVFRRLAAAKRLGTVIQTLTDEDVRLIWRGWFGAEPSAGRPARPALIALARRGLERAPALEVDGPDARARNALRFLIALTSGRTALRPEAAQALAVQLGYLTAVRHAAPGLPIWSALPGLPPAARRRLARAVIAAQGRAGPAADWVAALMQTDEGARDLARLGELLGDTEATPSGDRAPRPERCVSAAAGLALLLPAARAMNLHETIGRAGMLQLFTSLFSVRLRPVGAGDPAPAWLAGVSELERPRAMEAEVAWPNRETLMVPPETLTRDAEHLGTGPEAPLARALLDRFAHGLRGMEQASAGYLATRFLLLDGTLARDEARLTVRLHRAPLEVLLRMAGRLGEQGRIPWLGGRQLSVEVGDG